MDENVPNTPAPPPLIPPLPSTPPPPPVIIPPSPPPQRTRRNWIWMVLAFVVLLVLGFIAVNYFVGGVLGLNPSGRTSRAGPRLEEATVEDNGANDKIAVIPIEGIISGRSLDQTGYSIVELVKAQLKRAEEDSKVKAVILKVDSPGGEVLASDDIYRMIARFQTNSQKPVIASMGNLAASGGYYVSAPCRYIVANAMTITGSIGVILHTWNYRGLMDKVGVRPETYKSGKYKDMLSGDRELDEITPEEREMVQSLINETFDRFKEVVGSGRAQAHDKNTQNSGGNQGRALSRDWKDYADGRVLTGKEAYKLGFVDDLGDFQVAVARAKEISGVSSANLVRFAPRFDLSDIFRLFGRSEARSIKVDLGMEPPKLQAGQLYFVYPLWAR